MAPSTGQFLLSDRLWPLALGGHVLRLRFHPGCSGLLWGLWLAAGALVYRHWGMAEKGNGAREYRM